MEFVQQNVLAGCEAAAAEFAEAFLPLCASDVEVLAQQTDADACGRLLKVSLPDPDFVQAAGAARLHTLLYRICNICICCIKE